MRDLRSEVAEYLAAHAPAMVTEISLAVRARRRDVEDTLAAGGFRPAQRPEGANHRAIYFEVSPEPSRPVPTKLGNKSRARAMLDVLEDGRRYTRDDIFRITGRFFLTNNAAAELRRAGHDVRHEQDGDLHIYWLAPTAASCAEPEASPLLAAASALPPDAADDARPPVPQTSSTRLFAARTVRGATRSGRAA